MTNYIAIDSLGAKHTRTTNRTYTHTVVVMESYEDAVAQAHASHAANLKGAYKKDFDYRVAIATGNDPYPTRKWVDGIESVDAECQALRVADAKEAVDGGFDAYVARNLASKLQYVEGRKARGWFSKWLNLGWCGRADLAQKLAAKYTGQKIEILVATVK